MDINEIKIYYENLKKEILNIKDNQLSIGQDIIKYVYPIIRNYKIEIEGEENIPKNQNVLFVANHSNSHDIFTAYEFFSILNRRGSVMVATDCLNTITNQIFNISNATLLDRRNKNERNNSVNLLSSKILKGNDGLIFGEGTWNIHPYLSMHNIHNGAAKISLITGVPIIPVIFEYIEENGIIMSESKLYKKCVIRFGRPLNINYKNDLSLESAFIKETLVNLRNSIWNDNNIIKNNIDDIDIDVYLNHTYLKKFKSFGFTYNSDEEKEFLLFLDNEEKNNEYTIDENGCFIPGTTDKSNDYVRKLIR